MFVNIGGDEGGDSENARRVVEKLWLDVFVNHKFIEVPRSKTISQIRMI